MQVNKKSKDISEQKFSFHSLQCEEIEIMKIYINTSLAAPGALAHRLQSPKWPPGAQNGRQDLERFLGVCSNF